MKKQVKNNELNDAGENGLNIIKRFVDITKKIEEIKTCYEIDNELDASIEFLRNVDDFNVEKLEDIRLKHQQELNRIITENTYAIYSLLK